MKSVEQPGQRVEPQVSIPPPVGSSKLSTLNFISQQVGVTFLPSYSEGQQQLQPVSLGQLALTPGIVRAGNDLPPSTPWSFPSQIITRLPRCLLLWRNQAYWTSRNTLTQCNYRGPQELITIISEQSTTIRLSSLNP